jgi:hypothetical protein
MPAFAYPVRMRYARNLITFASHPLAFALENARETL